MRSNMNKSTSCIYMILGYYNHKSASNVRYIINYTLINISIRKYEYFLKEKR